jgi:hypothetical protein
MGNEDVSCVFDISGVSLAKAFQARAVGMFWRRKQKRSANRAFTYVDIQERIREEVSFAFMLPCLPHAAS